MELFQSHPSEYYTYRHLRGSVIAIEGVISVGKTTLGNKLVDFFNGIGLTARFYTEYVNPELLQQFISNMPKYSYSFQMIMLCKRIETYRQALEFSKTGGIAILDRSLLGDRTFALMAHENGHISDAEWECYLSMVKHEIMMEPDWILFLDCEVETAMSRIRKRGNQDEITGYSRQYLEKLNEMYHKAMDSTSQRVVKMDWNRVVDWSSDQESRETIDYFLSALTRK